MNKAPNFPKQLERRDPAADEEDEDGSVEGVEEVGSLDDDQGSSHRDDESEEEVDSGQEEKEDPALAGSSSGSEDDASDEEELMNDEQMMAVDQHLAGLFKTRAKGSKSAKGKEQGGWLWTLPDADNRSGCAEGSHPFQESSA